MCASTERIVSGFSQPTDDNMYVNVNVCFPYLTLDLCMCIYIYIYFIYMCVCVVVIHICVCLSVCVYDCLGSQRLSEPEFDEGTAVVSKGGWGFVS